MLGVGDVAGRPAGVVDPIGHGTAGVVERGGAHGHPIADGDLLAGDEIMEGDAGMHDVERHREEGRLHQLLEHIGEVPPLGGQMAAPELERIALVVGRPEEGQADDVVHVGVSEEKMRADRPAIGDHLAAELAQPSAGIEDQALLATAHLDAGRVAAVTHGRSRSAWDRAAHAPEMNGEAVGCPHQWSLSFPRRPIRSPATNRAALLISAPSGSTHPTV